MEEKICEEGRTRSIFAAREVANRWLRSSTSKSSVTISPLRIISPTDTCLSLWLTTTPLLLERSSELEM